jgi:hypothetical protein
MAVYAQLGPTKTIRSIYFVTEISRSAAYLIQICLFVKKKKKKSSKATFEIFYEKKKKKKKKKF